MSARPTVSQTWRTATVRQLESFRASTELSLSFPPTLSSAERKFIHRRASTVSGWRTESQGEGHKRFITVRKRQPSRLDILRDACEHGRTAELKEMLDDDGPNHLDRLLNTTSVSGHGDVARLLLEYGADPNYDHNDLWNASYCGHTDVVQLLVEYGADVDPEAEDGDSSTPLFVACEAGKTGVVRVLLENGANVQAVTWIDGEEYRFRDDDDHFEDCIGYLYGESRDEAINEYNERYREFSKEEQGIEPLLIACIGGHVDVAKLCLDYGADVNQWSGDRFDNFPSDEDGVMTPLSVACAKSNFDLMRLLLEHGAEGELPSLQSACARGNVSMAEFILDFTDDRCVETHDRRGVPLVYSRSITRLLRKDYAMSFYLNVIGHRDEHPERQERARDVVRCVVSYLAPRAEHA